MMANWRDTVLFSILERIWALTSKLSSDRLHFCRFKDIPVSFYKIYRYNIDIRFVHWKIFPDLKNVAAN